MSRIAAALTTDDLQHHERPCDADTVRALGLTGIHRPLGILILEVMESCAGESNGDAARLRDLTAAIQKLVRRQARIDKLTVNAHAVAHHMAREVVLNQCPRCQGRGFLPLAYGPDQPDTARGVDCPICLGSGRARRDFGARARVAGHDAYHGALRRFYEALETRLVEAEMSAWDSYRTRFRGN